MSYAWKVVPIDSTANTLAHHGIKGQKWGRRRFQNEDGTLTAVGKKRYQDTAPAKKSKSSNKSSFVQQYAPAYNSTTDWSVTAGRVDHKTYNYMVNSTLSALDKLVGDVGSKKAYETYKDRYDKQVDKAVESYKKYLEAANSTNISKEEKEKRQQQLANDLGVVEAMYAASDIYPELHNQLSYNWAKPMQEVAAEYESNKKDSIVPKNAVSKTMNGQTQSSQTETQKLSSQKQQEQRASNAATTTLAKYIDRGKEAVTSALTAVKEKAGQIADAAVEKGKSFLERILKKKG